MMQPAAKRARVGTSTEPREAERESREGSVAGVAGARQGKRDQKAEQKKLAATGRVINVKNVTGDLRKAANSDLPQEEEKKWGPVYTRKVAEDAERMDMIYLKAVLLATINKRDF